MTGRELKGLQLKGLWIELWIMEAMPSLHQGTCLE